mmetsp:Transcript_13358/g.22734  ORF Transcript_13358/g.22734 Transcript_13358/m.22734 type:complete len:96 (+) Transcript_13358:685-972(+)
MRVSSGASESIADFNCADFLPRLIPNAVTVITNHDLNWDGEPVKSSMNVFAVALEKPIWICSYVDNVSLWSYIWTDNTVCWTRPRLINTGAGNHC